MAKKQAKAKKPCNSVDAKLEFIKNLKKLGVAAYNEGPEGWSVAFVPADKDDGAANLIGFESGAFRPDPLEATGPHPAADAAALARQEIFQGGPITGVDPRVIAEVEAAAAKFEFESGLMDPAIGALIERVAASKTDEEREHYQSLLTKAQHESIVYSHS